MTCASTYPNTCYYCYECLSSLMTWYSFTLLHFSPFKKKLLINTDFIYMFTCMWRLGETILNHPFPYWWAVCSLHIFAINHSGAVAGLLYLPSYACTHMALSPRRAGASSRDTFVEINRHLCRGWEPHFKVCNLAYTAVDEFGSQSYPWPYTPSYWGHNLLVLEDPRNKFSRS